MSPLPQAVSKADDASAVQNRTEPWRAAVLLVLYILMDMSVYLASERASKGATKESLSFLSALFSMFLSSALSVAEDGPRGLQQCFDLRNIARVLPVAACFSFSTLALLKSFDYFDGAFIKLLGQMKLPLTALLSSLILGRRYSAIQWQGILLICASCCCFTSQELGDIHMAGASNIWLPLVMVLFNVLGSIFSERAFKAGPASKMPFTIVLTNMRVGELLSAFFFLVWQRGPYFYRKFFQGWDLSTVLVLGTLIGDSWLSGLMVRQLSSLTNKMAKCFSLVALFSLSLLTGKQHYSTPLVLSAVMIVLSQTIFATASLQQEHKKS